MKQLLKQTGWVVLSTLCFFCVLFVVQWLTFEVADLLLIENHLLLLLFSGILAYVLPKWYGLIGGSVFSVTLLLLMLSANNLSILTLNAGVIVLLGAATGSFARQKRWTYGAGSFLLVMLVLWNAYRNYSAIEVEKVSGAKQSDTAKLNKMALGFVSLDGTRLQLSEDTVYLVNFTFHACKPCREKQPSLDELRSRFAHAPFKLITIHSVDPVEDFRKYYRNYSNCYHNPNEKSNQQLGISSYPYEIIYDKKGCEIRRFAGFTRDSKNDYRKQTASLIKQLIHEN